MGEVVDPATGVKFPLLQTFWDGVKTRALGAGVRVKKIAFVGVKVYSVALYVDEAGARADLQRTQQAGELGSDDAVASALVSGPYTKVFQMQLVRHVTGKQFTDALEESLKPRMGDETAPLEEFKAHFADKHLDNGTNVLLLWRQPDALDLLICPPGTPLDDFSQAKPEATITSSKLTAALWGNYLDPSTPTPDARKRWIAGARELLG